MDFKYDSGTISVFRRDIRDEAGEQQLCSLVSLLGKRCYGLIISNLNDLEKPR